MSLIDKSRVELLESYMQMQDKLNDAENDRDALIEKCKQQKEIMDELRNKLHSSTARVMVLKRDAAKRR
ncbi:MAG: hypothetical protein R8K22_05295 [Mariprofundaceae bacterium]